MSLKTIRLELARTADFPQGAPDRGYEFAAPLTADGHLDLEAWRSTRDRCAFRRFWAGEAEERGHLVHRNDRWLFSFEGDSEGDEEPIFKFDRHRFVEGEYVTVTERDGEDRPFKIVRVA